MRLVYLPVYTAVHRLNSCSTYNWAKTFIETVSAYDPRAYFYLCFPALAHGGILKPVHRKDEEGEIEDAVVETGWSYDPRERIQSDRVCLVPMRMFWKQYDMKGIVTEEFYRAFNCRNGRYYYHAVLSVSPALAPLLKKLCSYTRRGKLVSVPMFTMDCFTMNMDTLKETGMELNEDDEIMQSLGYAVSVNFFDTQFTYEMGIEAARRWLAPCLVDRIIENSHVLPFGIHCDEIDGFIEGVQKAPKFTFNFCQRLTRSNTQYHKVFALYDEAFRAGYDFNVMVTTLSAKLDSCPEWFEVIQGLKRPDFIRKAATAHAFVTMSVREGFAAGLMELLYAGLIGIYPMKRWATALLPPDRYPFFYRNQNECRALIRYVMEHYEEAKAKIAWVRDFIRENYDADTINRRRWDIIREEVARAEAEEHSFSKSYQSILSDVVGCLGPGVDRVRMWDLVRLIRDCSKSRLDLMADQSTGTTGTNRFAFFREFERMGWRDNCQEEESIFERPGSQDT